ncbi:3310_t:CDS:2 [Ambispora gerdemannii]|uniref:3310_t:CDS:1 n=1 Tax=Ambispora gerdemannii TaxID=144530 RepID=A0A9N9B5E4_9GLOM|nr:3310_t:CDS:2 [Ambispora gerdemannii]
MSHPDLCFRAELCKILSNQTANFKQLIRVHAHLVRQERFAEISTNRETITQQAHDLHESWKEIIKSVYRDLRIESRTWTSEEIDIWIWLTKFITNSIRVGYLFADPENCIGTAAPEASPPIPFDEILYTLQMVEIEFVRLSCRLLSYYEVYPENLRNKYLPKITNNYSSSLSEYRESLRKWIYDDSDSCLVVGERGKKLQPDCFDDCLRFADLIGMNRDWQMDALKKFDKMKKKKSPSSDTMEQPPSSPSYSS